MKITPAGVEIEGIQLKEQIQTLTELTTLALQQSAKAMTKQAGGIQQLI